MQQDFILPSRPGELRGCCCCAARQRRLAGRGWTVRRNPVRDLWRLWSCLEESKMPSSFQKLWLAIESPARNDIATAPHVQRSSTRPRLSLRSSPAGKESVSRFVEERRLRFTLPQTKVVSEAELFSLQWACSSLPSACGCEGGPGSQLDDCRWTQPDVLHRRRLPLQSASVSWRSKKRSWSSWVGRSESVNEVR